MADEAKTFRDRTNPIDVSSWDGVFGFINGYQVTAGDGAFQVTDEPLTDRTCTVQVDFYPSAKGVDLYINGRWRSNLEKIPAELYGDNNLRRILRDALNIANRVLGTRALPGRPAGSMKTEVVSRINPLFRNHGSLS